MKIKCLGIFGPLAAIILSVSAQARPVDIIQSGEVKRIEYAGTCDEAYKEFPGQVYACVSLSTTPPTQGNGSDCTGPRCVKIKKPWELGQSVARPMLTNRALTVTRSPIVQKKDVVVCTAHNMHCRAVDECSADGSRYRKGDAGWRDVPSGSFCDDSMIKPIQPKGDVLNSSSARR